MSRVVESRLALVARRRLPERLETSRWFMAPAKRAIICGCLAVVAFFMFFRPEQNLSDVADEASAVQVRPFQERECQANEREIIYGDYALCRSFESLGRISAEVSHICVRLDRSYPIFRDRDRDGIGNCENRDGRIRSVTVTECARWNGWWDQNVSPGSSYVLGPHCMFSQAIMDALAEFPEAYGLVESPVAYKERMDGLAYSRELNKAKLGNAGRSRDNGNEECNGGDECGFMGYSYEGRGVGSEGDSPWYQSEPDYDTCIGDCFDMDNDGRTYDDVDGDGDGRYESDR